MYQMIGAILVDLNTTTLVDVRKLLKKTKISSKASLRKFVFMYDDGARIPEEAEKWCLASSFFPVLVLREGTKEEEEAAKAKIIEDRKEMMRRKTEEREEERKRMESIANR